MACDPHPRTPHAFLWVLVDTWGDLYVYKELWESLSYGVWRKPRDDEHDHQYSVKQYVEAVAWMEGNEIDLSNPGGQHEYGDYRRLARGEEISSRLMDQAGKAFRASAESEQLETYADRYRKYGLSFFDPVKSHQVGEDAVRQGLESRYHDRLGNWPRLHILDSCQELRVELANHRYRESSKLEWKDLNQRTSEKRTHMLDLLRYLLTWRNLGYVREYASSPLTMSMIRERMKRPSWHGRVS
jgi:hypothetical protein